LLPGYGRGCSLIAGPAATRRRCPVDDGRVLFRLTRKPLIPERVA